ncbi:MAG: VWA domain-containing protein [Saprospiraceae bacterium]|nr:VWA domain-containing protein [Saprospiraceae bacterium]
MKGWQFLAFEAPPGGSTFDQLFKIFKELLLYTSGNVAEALSWLTELDKEYKLTTDTYGIADFIEDLMQKGYLQQNPQEGVGGPLRPSSKMELAIRKSALEDIFGQLKKSKQGRHSTKTSGTGDEHTSEIRPFEFGDNLDKIALSETLKNAYVNHGINDFQLTQDDVRVYETFYQSRMSTVLMIDISHSMILYGEDRITPAKKVALALAELIQTKYPKDTLDIIVFGNDAWQIQLKDLPYLEVGPYHTNTVAGLELAMDLLRKRRNPNKQIFMITDGKPSCIKKGKKYYKNSWGLDRKIINRTLGLAQKCRKLDIPVTTFMIAKDPYLMRFVDQFTQANRGKAFYSSLKGLGEFVFADYKNNKKKRR